MPAAFGSPAPPDAAVPAVLGGVPGVPGGAASQIVNTPLEPLREPSRPDMVVTATKYSPAGTFFASAGTAHRKMPTFSTLRAT